MREKEPKNPLLVIVAMIFLSLFIILPPVFRIYFPAEDPYVEPEIVRHTLSCERISVLENKKITSRIFYENDVAVSNIMTFIVYTPTEDDMAKDDVVLEQTVEQEINYLKSISGINVQENASQIVVQITLDDVAANENEEELKNYLLETSLAIEYFQSKGFVCTKED